MMRAGGTGAIECALTEERGVALGAVAFLRDAYRTLQSTLDEASRWASHGRMRQQVCQYQSAQCNIWHPFGSARTLVLQDISHDPLSGLDSEVAQSE